MSVYDTEAGHYDDDWVKPTDLEENDAVVEWIRGVFGDEPRSVIDAGCGTGLALELRIADLKRDYYVGFDPSWAMVDRLHEKFPQARATVQTATEWLSNNPKAHADLVIGMFAAPSYMTPMDLARLIERARRMAFFMLYDSVWLPDYYTEENPAPVEVFEESADFMRSISHKATDVFKIGAFDVYSFEK